MHGRSCSAAFLVLIFTRSQYKCGGKQLNISLLEDNPLGLEPQNPPPVVPVAVHRELKGGLRPDEYEEFGVQVSTASAHPSSAQSSDFLAPEPPTEPPAASTPPVVRNGSCVSSDIDGCSDNESYQSSMPNTSDTEGFATSNLMDICRVSQALVSAPRTPLMMTPAQPQSCRRSPAPPLQRKTDPDYVSLIASGNQEGMVDVRDFQQLTAYLRNGVESEFEVKLKEVNCTRQTQTELISRVLCRAETILLIEEGSVGMGANPDKIPTVLAGRLNTLQNGSVRKRSLAAVGLPVNAGHIDVASLRERMVLAQPRLWDLLHPVPTESPTNVGLRDFCPSKSCSYWRDGFGTLRYRRSLGIWRILTQHALWAQTDASVNCLMLYVNRYLVVLALRNIQEGEPLLCYREDGAQQAMLHLWQRQAGHTKISRQQSLAPAAGDVSREVEPTFRKSAEVFVTESTASADSLTQEHPIEYHMERLRKSGEIVVWHLETYDSSMADWPSAVGVMYCLELLENFSTLLAVGHEVDRISVEENWAEGDPREKETEDTLTKAALMVRNIRPFIAKLGAQDYRAVLKERNLDEVAPIVNRLLEIGDNVWDLAESLSSGQ